MGRNYEHNKDGYIYIYAPNGNEDGNMNQLVMMRVKKDKILKRADYEYFVSLDPQIQNDIIARTEHQNL